MGTQKGEKKRQLVVFLPSARAGQILVVLILISVSAICCGSPPAPVQPVGEPMVVRVTADRPGLLYAAGEAATFTIEVTCGDRRPERGEVEVWVAQDGNPTKLHKERFDLAADAPIAVKASVDESAFLLCQAWASVGSSSGYDEKMVWYRTAGDPGKTSVELVTDREDALYGCGDAATFAACVKQSEEPVVEGYVELQLKREGSETTIAGQVLDLAAGTPLEISGTLGEPGFLYCRARMLANPDEHRPDYDWDVRTSAGFDVNRISPEGAMPEDFGAFWKDTLAKARQLPVDVDLQELETISNERAAYYRFSINTLNDERVYGYLGIPRGPGPFPAVVLYPGHGPGWSTPSDIGLTSRGVITLMMNVHKYPVPESPAEARKAMEEYAARHNVSNYSAAGDASRETAHSYTVLTGFCRAVDYVCSRDDWDGKHLVAAGGSQGGSLTLATAGLCGGKITMAMAGVPGGCDPSRFHQEGDPPIPDAWAYYDSVNFARLIRCPVRISVGFRDGSCPPERVFCAYNSLSGTDKSIFMEAREGHTVTPARQAVERDCILRGLGLQ